MSIATIFLLNTSALKRNNYIEHSDGSCYKISIYFSRWDMYDQGMTGCCWPSRSLINVSPFTFCFYIVSSSIYGFCLPVWYLFLYHYGFPWVIHILIVYCYNSNYIEVLNIYLHSLIVRNSSSDSVHDETLNDACLGVQQRNTAIKWQIKTLNDACLDVQHLNAAIT